MPDISRVPSELSVGVFEDNLLSTRLDTQERINSLFSDFNIPTIQHSAPIVPKDLGTDDILESRNLISRQDFLTSTDPKLNEIAKSQMLQDAQRNKALSKGVGLPKMVKYQEGQSKYTDDHWWSEAGKTKFGFNPYVTLAENDAFYHDNVWNNYSLLGKIWRGTATFAGRALSKLVTGLVGMVGDIGSMAWNGLEELNEAFGGQQNNFWADVSDNWLARKMEQADQYVKNQILPTYKSINYDNKGAFSKLFDPYFWTNDLADGAGFLLQFAIPASLLGKAAVLGKAGKLGRFGRVMSAGVGELPSASRLTKGLGSTLEFFTGSRNIGGITAHVFNTTMESVAETKEGFNNTVEELIQKGYSEHEAKQIAAESAPFQFGANMAILSVSSAFENKWFQTSVGNRINPFRSKIDAAGLVQARPNNLVGKFFTNNKWGNRIYFYGQQGAKAAVMEGYWEENAQLAAQRVARGEYMRRGKDTPSEGKMESATNFFKQLIKQTVDATNKKDREAADSIMAGAVIGILGGGMFNAFSGSRNIPQNDADGNPLFVDGKRVTKRATFPEGTRKRENREHAETVARVRNARDAWLSVNLMPQDIYNEDGTINEEKAKLRVNELNEKLGKVASVFQRKITLEELTDQTERENKQYILFGDYLKAHILNGSADALINRLKNWAKKDAKELEMYGVTEDMAENPIHWATVAQSLYDEFKKIDKIRFVNKNEEGQQEKPESYFQKERALKSLIFDNIAQREASKATAAKYAQLEAENDPFIAVNEFNSYNRLIARKEILENTLAQQNLDEDSRQHYQAELDKTNKQLDMRKSSLPEHDKSTTSDMIFEKGSDITAQERQIMSTINEYLGFQFAKEDFLRAVDAHDLIIKELSDPETGIQKWNQRVNYWEKAMARTRLAKLTDLGYTEYEIQNMSVEDQDKIIKEEKKKEEVVEEAKVEQKEEKKEEEKPLSKDELRSQVLALLKTIDPKTTEDNLDQQARLMVDYMQRNPGQYPDELRELLTLYLQDKVEEVKGDNKEAKSETETQPTGTDDVVVTPLSPIVVEKTNVVQTPSERKKQIHEEFNKETGLSTTLVGSVSRGEARENSDIDIILDGMPHVGKDKITTQERQENSNYAYDTLKYLAEQGIVTNFQLKPDGFGLTFEYKGEEFQVVPNPTRKKSTIAEGVPQSLLDEVRKAYNLHKQALENDTSFKEEAEREGMRFHNNKVDTHVDGGKNSGEITIVTSNPRDLVKGTLKTDDNNLARFNFLDNVLSGKLDKNDFKMVLSLSQKGDIFGIVADKNGIAQLFNDSGMPVKNGGLPIFFYLDYDMFESKNISKRRMEVVKPPFAVAPLTATPIELHKAFIGRDVIEMLKDRIRRTTVTASFSFLTQGLLFRDGVENTYSSIPKSEPTHSATELIQKGHILGKGEIPLEDMIVNGVYRRAQRIQFYLLKDVNDRNAGTEVAEFHPVTIGEIRNEEGQKIWDLLKNERGENIFEAAIKGNLESTRENLQTLSSLLRPDKFMILNLGSNILIVNLKKFKKFVTTDNVTPEQMRALTTVEDIKNSELNFTKTYYDNEDEVTMLSGVLGEGTDNYARFINNNVKTSAKTLKKGNIEGYARVNKRIALTLDENMDDMNKAANQKGQENKSQNITEVKIEEEFSDSEKTSIIFQERPEEENFDDDFTKTDCK